MNQVILIVDNNPVDRSEMELLLKAGGYKIEFADDAETALRMLIVNRPFLILIGLSMPGLDSYTFTRILKNDEDTRGIEIAAILNPGSKIGYELITCGFDDFFKIKSTENSFATEILNYLSHKKTIYKKEEKI